MNRALVYFGVQCFQLRDVHCIGIFTACSDACNLTGHTCFFVPYRQCGLGALVGSRDSIPLFLRSR